MSQSEVMLKPGVPEIAFKAIDAQNSRRRSRRHAARLTPDGIVYDSTNHFHPPKPPKEIHFPARQRPPPPPPLQEEMFHSQHQTQHGNTNTQSRYSSANQVKTKASQKSKTISKAKIVETSATQNTGTQNNHQKGSYPVIKHNLRPSPVTIPTSTKPQTIPPTKAPVKVVPEAYYEPKPTVNPSVPKVKTTPKSNVQPNGHSETVHHEQNAPEYSPQQINGKASAKATQEAVANQHDLAPVIRFAENPSENMDVEASLGIQALLDYAHAEHEHMHSHDHAHSHTHSHPDPQPSAAAQPETHSHPQPQPSAAAQPEKVYKEPQVKSKKTVSTKSTGQKTTTLNTGTKADANGPPAELEAKFTSMFDAWYKAKFGASKTTEPPAVVTRKIVKGKNAKQGKRRYKGTKKLSKPKKQNTTPPKKKRLNLFKQHSSAKSSTNYQQTKASSASQGNNKNRTPGPETNSVDKTALFQEFMTMFQDQLNTGGTVAPNPIKAPYVESKAIPTKTKYVESKATPTKAKYVESKAKPTKAKYVESKAKPTKATYVESKATPTKAAYVESKAPPTKASYVASKTTQTKDIYVASNSASKARSAKNTHVPSEVKAKPTKATYKAPKERTTNPTPGSSKKTAVIKAKFGPQKPGAYAITTTTTQKTPSNTGQTTVTSDPTQVQLVTLAHPENLALPHEHTKKNPEAPAEATGPSRSEVIAGMNDAGLPAPYAERGPNRRPGKARTRKPKQPKGTTTARPMVDPDVLADINEIRVAKGELPLTPHQVDVHGNLLPFYKRQMRIGRLPARHHPLHHHGGRQMQHQHQHQHPYPMPHQHSEQRFGSGVNNFQNMFYPQPTNNWGSMSYNPYPSPNNPVPAPPAPPPTPGPQKTRAEVPLQGPVNVTPVPSPQPAAAAAAAAGMPINANALYLFFNALSNMYQNQPQPPNGRRRTNYPQQQRNMPPINGMLGPNAYGQASTGQSNGNGESGMGDPHPHHLDLHHQAIHMEAGNAMTPNLHRQVHRLLRQRQRGHQRNMYGPFIQSPIVTANPALYDPDIYADLLEAQQNARAALLG